MTVLAGVRQATHMIADHDPSLPRVSIARWLRGPAATILFVAVPDTPTRETDAIRASLAARAATLRRRELAEMEGKAGQRSQSMLVAQMLIVLGYLLFLAYPAVSRII